MKKFTLLLALLLTGVMACWAGGLETAAERQAPETATFTKLSAAPATAGVGQLAKAKLSDKTLKAGSIATASTSAPARRAARKAASIADVLGTRYTIAHPTTGILRTYQGTVAKLADDSVKIQGFLFSDVSITAHVDVAAGTVSIKPQFVIDNTAGPIWLCKYDPEKKVYSTTDAITGTIEDGNIHINDGFGFFVTSGAQKGAYLTVGLMTWGEVASANGALTHKVISYDKYLSTKRRSVTTQNDWIVVHQTGADKARIVHIPTQAGYVALDVNLNYDKTVTADPQTLYSVSFYGGYSNYTMTETVKTGDTTVNVSADLLTPMPISVTTAADSTKLGFGKWMIASTSAGIASMFESSSLRTVAKLAFPEKPVFDLAGTGTEADPYLIKTPDDVNKLVVATLTDASQRSAQQNDVQSTAFTPVWKGKYFALANDIDFSGANFTLKPIGSSEYRFDGVLDGKGYTISNFNISNYAYDYVGLLATLGPDGTVKNINFKDCDITTVGYNDAIVVGKNYGKITDVTITNCSVAVSNSGIYAGLVSGNSFGPVSNVTVNGGSVNATYFLGGLLGRAWADVTNCHANGISVYGNGKQAYIGGIVGYLQHLSSDQTVKLTDCSVSGVIYSPATQMCIGAIAGEVAYGDIARCQAGARVLANTSGDVDAGGIAGALFKGTISDCAFAGQVSNPSGKVVGGILGKAAMVSGYDLTSTVSNSYSAAMIASASTDSIVGVVGSTEGLTVSNVYFDTQMAGFTHATYGKTTAELTAATAPAGLDGAAWTVTEGLYPRVKSIDTLDAAVVAAAPVTLAKSDNVNMVKNNFTYATANDVTWRGVYQSKYSTTGGYAYTFKDGTGVLNYKQYTDTIEVRRNNAYKFVILNIAPMPFDGEGTAASPWLIKTRADVQTLSGISNNANVTFDGGHFLVVNDIDMQGDTLVSINYDNAGKLRFEGNFNGGGHTIDNFVVSTTDYYAEGNSSGKPAGEVNPRSDKSSYYGGFFGNIGVNGVVKNLTIGAKAKFFIFSYGGAIAGQSYGVIDSCANYAPVVTYFSRSGGIVGVLNNNATVTNCYNAGTVSVGNNTAGGIAGYAGNKAVISNCENAGTVQAVFINSYQADGKQSAAGGIVGQSGTTIISDVVNAGPVISYKYVGGIVGNAGACTVSRAVNYGLLTSKSAMATLGQIAGNVGSNVLTISDSYYDNQLQKGGAVANADAPGVKGLTAAELVTGKLDSLNAPLWQQKAGNYPVLTIASKKVEALLASMSPILFAQGEKASFVKSPATLSNVDEVKWEVVKGQAFAINGTQLTPTVPTSGAAADTVVSALGKTKRYVPICTLNPDIFDGSGTAADPYLIKDTTDVQTLSSFIDETDYDYEGAHFLVVNDIDFTGVKLPVIAAAPHQFSADFNGNGKTFTGITVDESGDKTSSSLGLFGVVGTGGTVRNLTIDKSSFKGYSNVAAFISGLYGRAYNLVNHAPVSAASSVAGGIAAQAFTGASIGKCVNTADIAAKSNYAGGILGYTAANADVPVDSCQNSGLITGAGYLGGIAGAASATYYRCQNTGDLIATAKYGGGIVGYAYAPSSARYCSNSGTIATIEATGGIAGYVITHLSGPRFVADSCTNTGSITSATTTKKTNWYAGGILGRAYAGVTVSRCTNTGVVDVEDGYRGYYLGGIVGEGSGKPAAKDTIVDCWNTAAIRGAYNNAAGIAGGLEGDTSSFIIRCWNTGDVTTLNASTGNAAGIMGNGGCQFYDCWNAGSISANATHVGGIAGYLTGHTYHMERCANYGPVQSVGSKSASYVAQAGGLVGMGRPLMVDCYNFGPVTAWDKVGGLVGYPGNSAAASYAQSTERSYNAGKLTASQGTNVGNANSYNSSCKYLTVQDVWFDNEVNAVTDYDNELGVKGLSKKQFTELKIDDAFENQTACYPSLKVYHSGNDYNSFYVAMLLLADGEKLDSVATDFQVGTPEGAVWTSSDNLIIEGNNVKLANATPGDTATITLTVGKLSRTYHLVLMGNHSGVNDVTTAREVAAREVYDLQGRRIMRPADAQGVVIVVTRYTDGTASTVKQLGPVK